MCSPVRPLPELQPDALRPYLPAIRHAERLLSEELDRLRDRCEVQEWTVTRRNRRELRELRAQIQSWAD